MTDLVEFLRARRDEDEARARDWWVARSDAPGAYTTTYHNGELRYETEDGHPISEENIRKYYVKRAKPDKRVLADVAARRRLIDDLTSEPHLVVEDCWYTCAAATEAREGETTCRDDAEPRCDCGLDARTKRRLLILVQPDVDHPDFDPTWRASD